MNKIINEAQTNHEEHKHSFGFVSTIDIISKSKLVYFKVYKNNNLSQEQRNNENYFYSKKINSISILPLIKIETLTNNCFAHIFSYIPNNLINLVGKLSEKTVVEKIIFPLLDTLIEMHKNNFIHADLKLENIRVENFNEDLKIYLSDFGSTIELNSFKENKIGALSQHVPPDLTISTQFDIYSLGVLTFQLLFGFDFIKKYQMNGRSFEKIPESKLIDKKILKFIELCTEPSAVNRFQTLENAKLFLLDQNNYLLKTIKFEPYNIDMHFEFYLEVMRDVFLESQRSTLELETFLGHWGEKYYSRLKKWSNSNLHNLIQLKLYNEVIGTCEFFVTSEHRGQISLIYILPKYRGLGFGKKIESYMIDFFKKNHIKQVVLNVSKKNKKAIIFYKNLNWKITEETQYEGSYKLIKDLSL